jgi:hypothetical protein
MALAADDVVAAHAKSAPSMEAIASFLTELFAPAIYRPYAHQPRLHGPQRDGRLPQAVLDYVLREYHGQLPKACIGDGDSYFINIDPGHVLPWHAATTISGLTFPDDAGRLYRGGTGRRARQLAAEDGR